MTVAVTCAHCGYLSGTDPCYMCREAAKLYTDYVFESTDHGDFFRPSAQILVTIWADGRATLATRPHRDASWGPPIEGRKAEASTPTGAGHGSPYTQGTNEADGAVPRTNSGGRAINRRVGLEGLGGLSSGRSR